MAKVTVFGAGVAGLTAAHELNRLGHQVSVYEANPDAGGFFRSARKTQDQGMPSEYSWHGLGPWYHNVFDLMKQIPFDDKGSVYDRALSRPLNYGIVPDDANGPLDDEDVFTGRRRFRMTRRDQLARDWWLFRSWSTHRRSDERYALLNAAEHWRPWLSDLGWKTWRSTFGPWIGSEWTRVSLHHVGLFFQKNLMAGPPHAHPADADGPAWTHGSRDGWLLLKGPSNEFWFEPWVRHLKAVGVTLAFDTSLQELTFDGQRVTGAVLASGERVEADMFVLAINPFMAADILDKTPALRGIDTLRLFRPLVQDGPHTQVSFRIAFAEKIKWPNKPAAVIVADSEFDLTLFAEEQVWRRDVSLGEGVKALWTGTACAGTVPGRVHGLPLERCTKEEFVEEVLAQLRRCKGLDGLIREANGGRGFAEFPILRVEVWHEWTFSPEGIRPRQPKWVTTSSNQPYRPSQRTPIDNLLLAGAHTRTDADIWSIEGAVESGRRAARHLDPRVPLLSQHKPAWLRALSRLDDLCFALGLPHVVDLGALALVVLALVAIAESIHRAR